MSSTRTTTKFGGRDGGAGAGDVDGTEHAGAAIERERRKERGKRLFTSAL
jgi:hypothetical protein